MPNERKKPLKRDASLIPFSRDHHHALLLCWKIRTGLKNNIEIKRIKKYTEWFYANHIKPHFEIEEAYIFPVLGMDDELVKKAISDHTQLRRLFEDNENPEKSLSILEEELDKHVRFEERVLFQEIQKIATTEQLETIEKHHKGAVFVENEVDVFWK